MSDHAQGISIIHHAQGQGGRYVATVEGEAAKGHLKWEPPTGLPEDRVARDVRVATSTMVPKAIRGRGIAAKLVDRLVADAREQGFRIDPQCSYVARKFEDNPEWSELRA